MYVCVCAWVRKPLAPVRRRNKMLLIDAQYVRFLSTELVSRRLSAIQNFEMSPRFFAKNVPSFPATMKSSQ